MVGEVWTQYVMTGFWRARLCYRGALKMTDMKLQDMKLTDRVAGHEIAGHENGGPNSKT